MDSHSGQAAETGSAVGSRAFDTVLLRHDAAILSNIWHRAVRRWSDRLLLGGMAIAVFLALREALAGMAPGAHIYAVTGLAVLSGAGVGGLAGRRLAFHAAFGVMADAALSRRPVLVYLIAVHGAAAVLLLMLTGFAAPPTMVPAFLAYLVGVAIGHGLARRGDMDGEGGGGAGAPYMRKWAAFMERPALAAMIMAGLLLSLLLVFRAWNGERLRLIAAMASAAALLALSPVDARAITYRTLTGEPLSRIMARHAAGPLLFLTLAGPASLGLAGAPVALAVTGIGTLLLLLMELRILGYALHSKSMADLFVTLWLGIAGSAALLAPAAAVALFLVVAVYWYRRGAARLWLLV